MLPPGAERSALILGSGGVERLHKSKIAVVGLGGVGSWAAEILARTGVGELHIMDFDHVDVSNINRQIQAFPATVGQSKATALAVRLNQLDVGGEVVSHHGFMDAERFEALGMHFDFVVEAIDHITAKASLLAFLRKRGVPVISSMGAAARLDPTQIRSADLAHTSICPMARDLRKILKRKYDFPEIGPMGIVAVYSIEHPVGSAGGSAVNGSLAQVTVAFGAALAAHVIRALALPQPLL
ncbi:tRNA threonylcarbamoyladenosine dehydratase [Myxococcota bacterium]|nr:tRNA threonylcarbamoyladenosine dehydratase [Myxococcota bacterium]MBU1533828.1 tRNA threonylcarbamoyladenosine dehydratase [Myxococcota bacterium]